MEYCVFSSAKPLYGFLWFFKREAALWNPVFFLSAKLLYGILCCFFLICNGHCCQTKAKNRA